MRNMESRDSSMFSYLREFITERKIIMNDFISKKAVISITNRETVTTNPNNFTANEKFDDYMDDPYISSFGKWMFNNGYNTALVTVRMEADKLLISDVAPVVHGYWRKVEPILTRYTYICSVCETEIGYDKHGNLNFSDFCPNCGAELNKESEDNTNV